MNTAQSKLVWRLVGAVFLAFVASIALTWLIHSFMTGRETQKLIDNAFSDVTVKIRDRVDMRMIRQAMLARDRYYVLREEPWWNDPDESSRRLAGLAGDLGVDGICVADAKGILSHSSRRDEVGALDFVNATGQAREFASLLDEKTELAQPLMPNSLRGELLKYVGVWIPDGGFIQICCGEKSVRNLARTAVTGLTYDWHVGGDDGGIYITTGNGTIISHPVKGGEGGQWRDPGEDFRCEKRMIEGFPVYVCIPKRTAMVERRVLVVTSALLNGIALVLASVLVGIVIAGYVRGQIAAQRAKEMAMASDIQENALPRTFPPFPEERRIDIYADMQCAKEVGGDFYDFYFCGPDRVAFLVADVSGKGVPAALFMMRAKTAIKSIVQTGKPLDEAVCEANEILSRDNKAGMFVTAWIGEMDLATGVVSFVNAGHNPPVLMRGEKNPEGRRTDFVRSKPGLMLGMISGIPYPSDTLVLKPGEALYLYTDGITEQTDEKNALFGEERLAETLESLCENGTALFDGARSPFVGAVMACVKAHGLGVEQADDCTQLVIRYNGNAAATAVENA